MIKAWMGSETNKRSLLFFGIDKRNVEQLQKGNPLHIFGKEIGLDHDIVIHYRDDIRDIVKELQQGGMISKTTTVRESRADN